MGTSAKEAKAAEDEAKLLEASNNNDSVVKTDAETDKMEGDQGFIEWVKAYAIDFLSVIKNIAVGNTCYILLLINFTLERYSHGYSFFLPKYMEYNFEQSASRASLLTGASGGLAAAAGMIAGGFLASCMKLTQYATAKACLVVDFVILFATIFLLLQICPERKVANVTTPYNCTLDCTCGTQFMPVCDKSEGISYYSPCKAGCIDGLKTKSGMRYTNCSCVRNDAILTEGLCSTTCGWFWVYLGSSGITSFIATLALAPMINLFFSVIEEKDRAVGIGFMQVLSQIFGGMPSSVVFGAIIDSACILWNFNNGQRTSCGLYNKAHLRERIFGSGVGFKLAAIVVFSYAVYKIKQRFGSGSNSGGNSTDDGLIDVYKVSSQMDLREDEYDITWNTYLEARESALM